MISIFSDKTSVILRKMLMRPGDEWVIQDFIKTKDACYGIGQGRVAAVLNEMDRLGYLERKKRGAKSGAILANPDKLIADWVDEYRFDYNETRSFYTADKDILRRIRDYFKDKQDGYALTLHTGANLYTSFVRTEHAHLYLNAEDLEKDLLDLRQKLDLKQLVQGGNVHIIRPFYKKSVFFNARNIRGYPVVSNLQLYLDLYNFQPRGREHAEHLRSLLTESGKHLD